MSTEHISEEVEAARRALGQLTSAAQKRLRNIQNTREGLDKERVRVALGARLAMRGIDDIDAEYEEEENQLAGALNLEAPAPNEPTTVEPPAAPQATEDTAAATPTTPTQVEDDELADQLYTEQELEELSDEDLQRLAASYDIVVVVTPANRRNVIVMILDAQSIWCAENDVEDPNAPARRRIVDYVNVRQWKDAQWVLAILGAFVAFVVAYITRGFPDGIHGSNRGLFAFGWVVVLTAFGFFLGGFIGSIIDRDE
jgi:hypothetical protein